MRGDRNWHYFDMPDLVWAKALVAALASAHGTARWFDAIEQGGGLLRSGLLSAKTMRTSSVAYLGSLVVSAERYFLADIAARGP